MTKAKKKANEDADYNAWVQEAVDGIQLGIYKSSYHAAKELNVKPSTVQARMNGRKTRIKSHEEQQALTAIEELELVRWITQLTIAGYHPRPGTLKAMAEALIHRRVAQINDDGMELVSYPPLGKEWYKQFRNRYPEINTIVGTAIEMSRMKDASKEVLEKWFETFRSITEFYDIHPQNIYNMDESGFSIGEIEASRVVVNKKVRQKYQAQPGRQEWVTAVETICIDGTAIPPLI